MTTQAQGRVTRLPKRKPRAWITPADAADYLNRGRSTIYRYCEEGHLAHWREPGSRQLKICAKSVEDYGRKIDGHELPSNEGEAA